MEMHSLCNKYQRLLEWLKINEYIFSVLIKSNYINYLFIFNLFYTNLDKFIKYTENICK